MLSLDKWGLQITPAAVGGVEGARRKVLLPVFNEWLPEGSYDNSSQPCPSRSLTSSTPLQQNGMAYQLTQWGVISTHPLVSGHNMGRSWNEIVVAGTYMSSWNSLSLDVGHRTFFKGPTLLSYCNFIKKNISRVLVLCCKIHCVSVHERWLIPQWINFNMLVEFRFVYINTIVVGWPRQVDQIIYLCIQKARLAATMTKKAHPQIWLKLIVQYNIFIPALTVLSFFSLVVLLFTHFTLS